MGKETEFADQSVEELKALYHEHTKSLYDLRNEVRLNRKLEKPHLMKKTKQNKARIMTFLRQKSGKLEV